MRFLAITVLAAALFSSCTTPAKTYKPPNSAAVTSQTTKVTDGATRAHEAARSAKVHVEAAQKHADALSVKSLDIQKKLDAIIKVAPPELQSALGAVKTDVTEMQGEQDQLKSELTDGYAKQNLLEVIQMAHDSDIAQLKTFQSQYVNNAQTLADAATSESQQRYAAQSQLVKEKIFSILWKIGGGAVVVLVIVLVVLWFTGKLAFKFAK